MFLATEHSPRTVAALLARCRSVRKPIIYKLGAGGLNPAASSPADGGGQCDCAGAVCWALGISRKSNDPFYLKKSGGWIYTTSLVQDGADPAGMFDTIAAPAPGCLIVYPHSNGKPGHVGIVTSTTANGGLVAAKTVWHCSSGNYRARGNALAETGPDVWLRNSQTIYLWPKGLFPA